MSARRNALTASAVSLCPAIGEGLQALRGTSKCQLARMAGSGATCFGLYEQEESARVAADILQTAFPTWWVAVTSLA